MYTWRTSSYSENGEKCVEAAPTSDGAIIRDTKNPSAGTISFNQDAWRGFVFEACTGADGDNGTARITRTEDGGALVQSLLDGLELRFDAGEWSAFVSGARDGEFDFRGSTPHTHRV